MNMLELNLRPRGTCVSCQAFLFFTNENRENNLSYHTQEYITFDEYSLSCQLMMMMMMKMLGRWQVGSNFRIFAFMPAASTVKVMDAHRSSTVRGVQFTYTEEYRFCGGDP